MTRQMEVALNKRTFMAILVVAALLGGLIAQPLSAQEGQLYDHAWLVSVAQQPNAQDQLNLAFINRLGVGWRAEGVGGTFDVPANSVVIADKMNAGNNPAFEQIGPNVWYTAPGGRFGTSGVFRSFQLDGGIDQETTVIGLNTIDEMILSVRAETNYGAMIELLDVMWSGGDAPINRWGSSGPLEVLTENQLSLLEGSGDLQPLLQTLPGNTLVWGELAPGEHHMGLVMIAQNLYATTCQGGVFATLRGFRAMQFEEAGPGWVLSDTTGCNGQYPLLDPENPVSVAPLNVGAVLPEQEGVVVTVDTVDPE